MHRFFVYNPVFAWVIAAFITLFGVICLAMLPVEQYPDVAPPSLTLSINYNGADAQTLDRNVTSIIEKEMNGVDNFLYMASTSRSNGTAEVKVTFRPGTDLDIARTQVQDRLSRVEPRLPQEVRQVGVGVTKSSSGFLMLVALTSESGNTTPYELGNYASTKIMDELRRVPGVGDVMLLGTPYAMRIWLDPEKLAGYGLSASEVLAAVQEQNSQTAGGGLAEQPITRTAEFTAKILTQNRFSSADQFRQIIVRANLDGSSIRLGDVARVELGAENYGFSATYNGKDSTAMAVQLASGANALSTAEGVREVVADLAKSFPPDIAWTVPYDTTPFINASVSSVVQTLIEAMLLVFLVMFVFLQNWRSTVIAAVVVPIALAGACFGLWLFGSSINTLSLFGMVVAIGILVDDAIVVVENVERIMAEEGLNPRLATIKAMRQITGALVGITLVLVAVFVPMAFFPGSTGGIYRQFSITLAVSIFFSFVLAITLTPALCATLLKPHARGADGEAPDPAPGLRGLPRRLGNGFNERFQRATGTYTRSVGTMLSAPLRWLAVFVAMVAVTLLLYSRLPGGFLPTEDQGVIMVNYDAAPGATLQRTAQATGQAQAWLHQQPEVRGVTTVIGFNFFSQGQSSAVSFVALNPWDDRTRASESAEALIARANAAFSNIPEATIFGLSPPPIMALGNAIGFSMKIEDRSGHGGAALEQARNRILAEAAKSPVLAGVRPEGPPPAPQLYVDIDRIQARTLGLQIADVNQTLSIAFGSVYANDFVREGNVLRVYLQAIADQRMTPQQILSLRVRNNRGEMVPFSAFTSVKWRSGPQQLERYNGYPSLTISGQAAPGKSSGAALVAMEKIANSVLTGDQRFEWTGTAYEEKQAGSQIGMVLGLSLVVIFLLLSALYGSWAIPLSVLLIVPFGVLGAVLFAMLRGFPGDVYFNVGLITVIGLAAKNAILIVEFAMAEEQAGKDARSATLAAVRQRLRPILMTSFAFILGMLPLVVASGAGAASRQAVGTGVAGGMLVATFLGLFFTPVFYLSARIWLSRDNDHAAQDRLELARLEQAGRDEQAEDPSHA